MKKYSIYMPALTPLRGIAAIWVVAYHFEAILKFAGLQTITNPDTSMLLLKGYIWVDFFFLLSGFIMTHLYGEEFGKGISRTSLWNYLSSRFAKLYPLHLFAMIVHLPVVMSLYWFFPSLVAEFGSFYPWQGIPVHLLMLQSFTREFGFSWNIPAWSIGAEWWTYMLAIGLFYISYRKNKFISIVLSGLSLVLLIVLVNTHSKQNLDVTWGLGIFRCIAEFTLGSLLYQLYQSKVAHSFFKRDISFILAAFSVLLIMHGKWHDVWMIPFLGWMIISAASNQGHVLVLMSSRPMQFIGNISYSVYMMQGVWLIIHLIGLRSWAIQAGVDNISIGMKLLLLGVMLAANILSAMYTYTYIEVPGRIWLKKKLSEITLPKKVAA